MLIDLHGAAGLYGRDGGVALGFIGFEDSLRLLGFVEGLLELKWEFPKIRCTLFRAP